jgi:hypothetical protein
LEIISSQYSRFEDCIEPTTNENIKEEITDFVNAENPYDDACGFVIKADDIKCEIKEEESAGDSILIQQNIGTKNIPLLFFL